MPRIQRNDNVVGSREFPKITPQQLAGSEPHAKSGQKIRRNGGPANVPFAVQTEEKTPEMNRGHKPAAAEKRRKTRRKGDWIYTVAMVVFAGIFLVSGGMLAKRFLDDRRTENEFAELSNLIDTAAPTPTGDSEEETNAAKFAALKEQNQDFMGWITLPETGLDLPVMYAPDNKDYYLRHSFDGEYSIYGVPYLDERTTMGLNAQSMNLVVYGHNMKTGTIFGCLTEYNKAEYYAEHPTITFDTLYGNGEYEVFAAFAIDVVADTSFRYNDYIDLNEQTYNEFVDEALERSAVKTGIRPSYGEQLLTLSTCEYSSDNGRYVVVARKMETEES